MARLSYILCPVCKSEYVDYTIHAEKQGNLVWHCECKACRHRWDELKLFRPNFTASVDSKGRITIRSDVRESLGIKAGDKVRVIEMEKV